jgi:DNA adenine methylase
MTTSRDARPFIKWVGGKTQLLPHIEALLPKEMRTYYEPFIGGGAVFWHVAATRTFERAVINDWNAELVNTYTVIRDFPGTLITALSDHMNHALWNTAEYFAEMRASVPSDLDSVARAARMIYLNKTCFNGLYRVNKRGQFNTPFGRYKNPALFDASNIRACSEALKRNVSILTGDFNNAILNAGSGDVVYFDPPYVPLSATSNFASYTSTGFDIGDQQRLAALFKDLTVRDVTCVLSNSDTPVVRKLYEGFEILSVQAKRAINSKADGRGAVGEVLVIHRGSAHKEEEDPYEMLSAPP